MQLKVGRAGRLGNNTGEDLRTRVHYVHTPSVQYVGLDINKQLQFRRYSRKKHILKSDTFKYGNPM
jgi:hypothetical protein